MSGWKVLGFQGLQTGKQRSKICLCRPISVWTFHLVHGRKTFPGEEIYGSPHFLEVSVFSQIGEALRRCLSVSPILIFLQLKIIFMPKWCFLGWHILVPCMLLHSEFWIPDLWCSFISVSICLIIFKLYGIVFLCLMVVWGNIFVTWKGFILISYMVALYGCCLPSSV